mgnify:FL=1
MGQHRLRMVSGLQRSRRICDCISKSSLERLGTVAMKKICEIDAMLIYQRTGSMPWDNRVTDHHRLKAEWMNSAFTEPQRRFLEKHSYAARPHPRHSPNVEIFVDEQKLCEQDWTHLRLLF